MDLNSLVAGGDKYQVFITIGSVPVYMFLTSSAVGRQLSQDLNPIYAIGTDKPIATKSAAKNNAFNISLQDGEANIILKAAKLALGSDIHDFRDMPSNTNITVINLTSGSIEKFIGCKFGGDNKNVERQSVETIRELSGICLDYKSV